MRGQCAHEKLEDVHQKQRGTQEFVPKGQQKTQMIYIGLTLWEDHPLIVDSLSKTLIKVGGIFHGHGGCRVFLKSTTGCRVPGRQAVDVLPGKTADGLRTVTGHGASG